MIINSILILVFLEEFNECFFWYMLICIYVIIIVELIVIMEFINFFLILF